MKKLFHQSNKYSVDSLTISSLKKRWRERSERYHFECAQELEAQRKKEKEDEMRLECIRRDMAQQHAQHIEQVTVNEENYINISTSSDTDGTSTSPLLLNTVVTLIVEEAICTCTSEMLGTKCKGEIRKARHERNQALTLAQQYRNLAEKSQSEKRSLKNDLEGKIETVRDFWRNKIVEGDSRSGRKLRAALIRK